MSLKDLRRADFRYRMDIQTRWADGDPYGHVNNMVYLGWFDTCITRMLQERALVSLHDSANVAYCVENHCEYFASVVFPQTVEVHLRIGRVGNSSLRYEIGIFLPDRDEPIAAGHFVHVMVDRQTRRPAALTETQKAQVADLVV